MPACQIEDYHDSPPARDELVTWLVTTDAQGLTVEAWHRRLAHWWDENPFAVLRNERGWVLRQNGAICGFFGLIPTCYAAKGAPVPAFISSTWRIDEPCRNASLPMLMRSRRLGTEAIIADTTPTPTVRELLKRTGWTGFIDIQKRFVPLGFLNTLLLRGSWPVLPAGRHLVIDPAMVRSVSASCLSCSGVEKWITPEYLRWFAASGMRRHQFVGVIDESGCLSSYLFVTPKRIRGIPAWTEIDHFTTASTNDELHALVGELVRRPGVLGGRRLLSLAAFPGDPTWDEAPALHRRPENVCHYFAIPDPLKALPKRTVLAEGDWGL